MADRVEDGAPKSGNLLGWHVYWVVFVVDDGASTSGNLLGWCIYWVDDYSLWWTKVRMGGMITDFGELR